MLFLLIAALLAAGQAIAFVWLSNFPERASQLESLEIQFWSYAVVSAALVIADLALFGRIVREIRDRRRRSRAPEQATSKG
jgi:hypothetical protein